MTSKHDSQFWKTLAGIGSGLLLALAVQAAPDDDYRDGERAFKTGDLVAATAKLRRAAEAGHAPAQVMLAGILDQAEFDDEALAWYRKAAEQGEAGGAYGVGAMYMAGEGVKRDLAVAYGWFLRAAERGHELATVALSHAYIRAEKGEISPGPEAARAGEWLRKAAAFGDLAAIEALAEAHRSGRYGVAPDARLADDYAARAAAIRRKMSIETGRKKK